PACNGSEPLGFCCVNGECLPNYTESDCEEESGNWHADGEDCDNDPECMFVPSIITCCASGECIQATAIECAALGGIVYPSDALCDELCDGPPPVPVDCCVDGECSQANTAEDCLALGGIVYFPGTNCNDDCVPTPTGACCISGECFEDWTEEDCLASNGIYTGDSAPCVVDSCVSTCEDVEIDTEVIPEITPTVNNFYVPAWTNGNSTNII
ncbi:MAG TPA: hypothetical protein PKD00_07295, partial [Burkholderiales bacterium]|nr:hypothetical protein [Burkholderiales bacterium]